MNLKTVQLWMFICWMICRSVICLLVMLYNYELIEKLLILLNHILLFLMFEEQHLKYSHVNVYRKVFCIARFIVIFMIAFYDWLDVLLKIIWWGYSKLLLYVLNWINYKFIILITKIRVDYNILFFIIPYHWILILL